MATEKGLKRDMPPRAECDAPGLQKVEKRKM